MQMIGKITKAKFNYFKLFNWFRKGELERENSTSELTSHMKKDIGLTDEPEATSHYSKFL